jgi:hypothetical protein
VRVCEAVARERALRNHLLAAIHGVTAKGSGSTGPAIHGRAFAGARASGSQAGVAQSLSGSHPWRDS